MPESDFQLVARSLERVASKAGLGDAYELTVRLADLCREAGDAREHPARDEALGIVGRQSNAVLAMLLRLITTQFHLRNKAEQLHIAHVNRERERAATADRPRAESIAEAVLRLKAAGLDLEALLELSTSLDVEPTFTAHPTEARRRSMMDKQQRVAGILELIRSRDALPVEKRIEEDRLDRIVHLMLVTDDVRHRRLEVPDEVRNGLYFLTSAVWDVVPKLDDDLRHAVRQVYGADAVARVAEAAPVLVRYRSWIGGDRDGNPRVTAEVTRHTLETFRDAAIEKHVEALTDVRHALSVSTSWVKPPAELIEAVERYARFDPPDADLLRGTEPVRLLIDQIAGRLRTDPGYRAAELLADLDLLRRSLIEMGLAEHARDGKLAALILRARTFGLRLATLDIRQHSGVHEAAVAELLRVGGAGDDYAELDEAGRLQRLREELARPRPLHPAHAELSPMTRETLDTLAVVLEARRRDEGAVRSYVISMTSAVSDVLEVLLLMKEAGLYRVCEGGRIESDLDVVPLFETIDDLRRAPELLEAMFADPAYRAHLDARRARDGLARPFQEVMLGYSDSNKDGGYFMAGAALDAAQTAVTRACDAAGVDMRLFHGRGGSIGRGGGRANRAILAAPPGAHRGRIRFTEQGEVISFRYALPAIARRHLEQIVSAMLLVSADHGEPPAPPPDEAARLIARIAPASMRAYRRLIDDPAFWPWFTTVSPIAFIGGLPIASRPVSRAAPGQGLTFDKLRAIPWNFAWIQIRAGVPGWYGFGDALGELNDAELATLADAYPRWPFLGALFDNAEHELARARMPIARLYASAAGADPAIMQTIESAYERTVELLRRVTGRDRLLDIAPAIQNAIVVRTPWTDVLSLVQIELLRRARESPEPAGLDELRPLLFASINAIAAAMQSTG